MICSNLEFLQIPEGTSINYSKKRNTSSLRLSVNTERVVNVRNHLPSDLVEFSTLTAFQRTIKLVDFTDYLNCV